MLTRRTCVSAITAAPFLRAAESQDLLGQGEYRYRVVPGWGVLDDKTPVKNCHGMVRDRQGHLILLTDHTANNVIVYDKRGHLVSKWGTNFPGAHGLSLVIEGGREVLYITDLETHKVAKTISMAGYSKSGDGLQPLESTAKRPNTNPPGRCI